MFIEKLNEIFGKSERVPLILSVFIGFTKVMSVTSSVLVHAKHARHTSRARSRGRTQPVQRQEVVFAELFVVEG